MWLALFGPSLLGLSESVRPGTSPIPFSRTFKKMTARSGPQMHPLTDFLFLSPVLLGLYKVVPNVIIEVRRKALSQLLTLFEENSHSGVAKNTLLHGKSLLVIATGDSKSISLEFITDNNAINVRAHSTITEMTTRFK